MQPREIADPSPDNPSQRDWGRTMTEAGRRQAGILDRMELSDLVSRLGFWLDGQRFDQPECLFTEDAFARTPGGTAQGRERLVAQARKNHSHGSTQHFITNVLIDLDGDLAEIGANLFVKFVYVRDGQERHYDLGERYHLHAVRTANGWRLSRIETAVVWSLGERPSAPGGDPAPSGNLRA